MLHIFNGRECEFVFPSHSLLVYILCIGLYFVVLMPFRLYLDYMCMQKRVYTGG